MAGHLRDKLKSVLEDPVKLRRSAEKTFRQFDEENLGILDFERVKELIRRLIVNLQLPPVDDPTLLDIIDRYGAEGTLSADQFLHLYADLLVRIKSAYFPERLSFDRQELVPTLQLRNTDDIGSHLSFLARLGSGSFGEVHLVHDKKLSLKCVCKTISKFQAKLPISQIAAEVDILKKLDHPNIIKVYSVYEDRKNLYLCMEHCGGGELMAKVEEMHKAGTRLPEKSVAKIMADVLSAVSYIHQVQHVAHKDLKPENIMFCGKDQSQVKLIDFGVAELFHNIDGCSDKSAGTALYMAPEVVRRRFGLKCDIWSCGCILYLLLTGSYPFMARNWEGMKQLITQAEPSYAKDCVGVSEKAVDLLKHMLVKDPRMRYTAIECLESPWLEAMGVVVPQKTSPFDVRDILGNLKLFSNQSCLKRVIVNLMAHFLSIKGRRVREVISQFRLFDRDQNGVISPNEFRTTLKPFGWRDETITRLFLALDLTHRGVIEYTEFLAGSYTWRLSELSAAWSAFSILDRNKDGKIDSRDFVNLLTTSKQTSDMEALQLQEVREMVSRRLDPGNKGFIEWHDFVTFMRDGQDYD